MKEEVARLWELFRDVPIDENECIDIDFSVWEKGTDRYEILAWFDENSEAGVAAMMYK